MGNSNKRASLIIEGIAEENSSVLTNQQEFEITLKKSNELSPSSQRLNSEKNPSELYLNEKYTSTSNRYSTSNNSGKETKNGDNYVNKPEEKKTEHNYLNESKDLNSEFQKAENYTNESQVNQKADNYSNESQVNQKTDSYANQSQAETNLSSINELEQEEKLNQKKLQKRGKKNKFKSSISKKDWNAEFQEIWTEREVHLEVEDNQTILVRLRLGKLVKQFNEAALEIGKQIINELDIIDEEKAIPPIKAGGIAGGSKYVYSGIFFKFVTDEGNLFGSYNNACKAATHELRGLSLYVHLSLRKEISGLSFPLMCVIQYLGYTLICTSILPINNSTLVYGSSDGGNTVHTDLEFDSILATAAKKINIKPHYVGTTFLHACGDIEGHRGLDGKKYLVDTHRVLPPTNSTSKGEFLYHLFRPEFCESYSTNLNPDGFCGWGRDDPNYKQYDLELIQATDYLKTQLIPQVATILDSNSEKKSLREILVYIHRKGINFRYLGIVRNHCKNEPLKSLLLEEMVARVLKIRIKNILRIEETRSSAFEQISKLLISCFGESSEAEKFWSSFIKPWVWKKFISVFSQQELQDPDFILQKQLSIPNLFNRLAYLINVQLKPGIWTKLKKSSNLSFQFNQDHIISIQPKVKQLYFVHFYEGFLFQLEGSKKKSTELLDKACEKYLQGLERRPNDVLTLVNWAIALCWKSRLLSSDQRNLSFKEGLQKYQEALEIRPQDIFTLLNYGISLMLQCTFLESSNTEQIMEYLTLAEKQFQLVLDQDSQNVKGLTQMTLVKLELSYQSSESDYLDQAESHCSQLLKCAPQSPLALKLMKTISKQKKKLSSEKDLKPSFLERFFRKRNYASEMVASNPLYEMKEDVATNPLYLV